MITCPRAFQVHTVFASGVTMAGGSSMRRVSVGGDWSFTYVPRFQKKSSSVADQKPAEPAPRYSRLQLLAVIATSSQIPHGTSAASNCTLVTYVSPLKRPDQNTSVAFCCQNAAASGGQKAASLPARSSPPASVPSVVPGHPSARLSVVVRRFVNAGGAGCWIEAIA